MKVPKIVLIVSGVLVVPLLVLVLLLVMQFIREVANVPLNVTISNVTGNSATVSWYTKEKSFGNVIYGTNKNALMGFLAYVGNKIAFDDRDYLAAAEKILGSDASTAIDNVDSEFNVDLKSGKDAEQVEVKDLGRYYVHHVTIQNLNEDTRYYFKIGNGFWTWDYTLKNSAVDDGYLESSFKTFNHPKNLEAPNPAYGRVYELVRGKDGLVKESNNKDAIVYVKAKKSVGDTQTMLLSAITNSDGGWVVDKSNFRTTDGLMASGFQTKKDILSVQVQSGNSEKLVNQDFVWGFDDSPTPFLFTNSLESEVKEEYPATPWYVLNLSSGYFVLISLGAIFSLVGLVFLLLKSKGSLFSKSSGTVSVLFFGIAAVSVGSLVLTPTFANCAETNTCRDWNALMEARAETARNNGDEGAAKKYENKMVNQEALDAQLQRAYELANGYKGGDQADISKMTRALELEKQGATLSAADQAILNKFNTLSASDQQIVNQMAVMQRPNGAYSTDLKAQAQAEKDRVAQEQLAALEAARAAEAGCREQSAKGMNCVSLASGGCSCSSPVPLSSVFQQYGPAAPTSPSSSAPYTYFIPTYSTVTPTPTVVAANVPVESGNTTAMDTLETITLSDNTTAAAHLTSYVDYMNNTVTDSKAALDAACARLGLSGQACTVNQSGNSADVNAFNQAKYDYEQAQENLEYAQVSYQEVLAGAENYQSILDQKAAKQAELDAGLAALGYNNVESLMNAQTSKFLFWDTPKNDTEKQILALRQTYQDIQNIEFYEDKALEGVTHELYYLPVPEEDTSTGGDTGSSLITKAYAQESNTPLTLLDGNDYIFYLPESGGYVIDVNNSSIGLVTEESKDYALYYERNGEKGFQPPADPLNVKENEDKLVNIKASKVNIDKIFKTFTMTLKKGINIVSFPYLPSADMKGAMKASEFLSMANIADAKVKTITTFDAGKWSGGLVYGDTNSGVDFDLTFGKGYLVIADTDSTFQVSGYGIKSSIPVALSSGWNLVGIHGYTETYTASSLIDSIGTIEGLGADNVTYWPTSKGRYEGLQKSEGTEYGFDFPIREDLGYFVRINKFEPKETSTKSIIWNPGGDLNGKPGSN